MSARVVLVVGGARRIGRAISLEFARRGYLVAVNARQSLDEAHETVRMIESAGGQAVVAMGDATQPDQAAAAVGAAVQAGGRLDAVVYCAAQRVHGPLLGLDPAHWQRGIDSVLTGSFLIAQHAAPHLMRQGGSITLISGASAFVGSVGPATPAAKAGLVGLARALACELGPSGVRVNVLSPGRIEAEGDAASYLERLRAARPDSSIPLRRAGTTGDIAGVAAAMAGDEFAYVTGQVVHVNGGLYMG